MLRRLTAFSVLLAMTFLSGCAAKRVANGSAWLEGGGQLQPLRAMSVYLCDHKVFEGEYLSKSIPGGIPEINRQTVAREGAQLEAIASSDSSFARSPLNK